MPIESLWVLRFGLHFLMKSISKVRHSNLVRHFLRILKLARKFDGLKSCFLRNVSRSRNVYAYQHADGEDSI